MPWIKQIPIEEASGLLKSQFDAALKRAGRVWHIVHIMSLNPRMLRDSITFYATAMMGESPLSRVQREMLAVVVSFENHCYYWTQAHAHDLRDEVGKIMNAEGADAFVHTVVRDWRTAPLSAIDMALCEYAAKLTLTPAQMSPTDLDVLHSQGLDDRAIHDATQVISYFNYINRIADALGVEPEDFIIPWGR